MRVLALDLTLALTLSVVAVLSQSRPPAPQSRDNAPPPVGTATLSGRIVIDDNSGQPLRRVTVMLSSGGLQIPQTTLTDDSGRYRFTALLHGSFTVAVSRAGYVPAFYGSKRAGKGPGIPIAVLDGQQVSNIDFRLMRGSVITGTVRSQSGQPAAGLDVQVTPVQTVDGQRRMSTSGLMSMALAGGPSLTDDRGVYRVYGLPPGDYLVQTGMIGAGVPEARQVTTAEVQWAQQAMTSAPGSAAASGAPQAAAPEPGHTMAYSPVYFPGTTIAAEATVVTIGPGEERRGVDFSTQLVPTAKVTGTVLDPDGRPVTGVQLSLGGAQSSPSDFSALMLASSGTRTNAEGVFSMSGVKPGRYTVTARGGPPPDGRQPQGLEAMLGARAPGLNAVSGELGALAGLLGASQPWWAREDVTIDGRDVTNITLRLQPGMTISGRVVYDGTAAPPADLTKTRVSFGGVPSSASPIELAMSAMTGTSLAVTAADGTFVAKNMVPGKYRGSLGGGSASMFLALLAPSSPQSNNWSLKSIMLNGRDVADVPFEVRPSEDVTGVVVTLTDRPTELSGAVLDQTGQATGNFPIVVFSTDKTYWTIGSRRVQQARPASDGKFKVSGLPAGEYFVMAVTDLDPEDLYNPAFLEELSAAGAYKIRLADGEKRVQDLRLK